MDRKAITTKSNVSGDITQLLLILIKKAVSDYMRISGDDHTTTGGVSHFSGAKYALSSGRDTSTVETTVPPLHGTPTYCLEVILRMLVISAGCERIRSNSEHAGTLSSNSEPAPMHWTPTNIEVAALWSLQERMNKGKRDEEIHLKRKLLMQTMMVLNEGSSCYPLNRGIRCFGVGMIQNTRKIEGVAV
ncbi:unnamed protein product [Phytophthora lilii]|uniref:Unnamed protein product n=1 Tax=Phytophthora lilii TaxID=2077276 RepID=A0A9W6U3H5_9STRA|nr:unnamed protein product [Phytophthora lilii]